MLRLLRHHRKDKPDEPEFPPAPPPPLQRRYHQLSWSYIRWCAGMIVWCILCVIYFIITLQHWNTYIGIGLGLMLVAMIVMPELLFGGVTWHKRLAWMTILLGLFSIMWVYPIIVVVLGICRRIFADTYRHWPEPKEILHIGVCVLTLLMTVWTDIVMVRAVKLVRTLYRGDYDTEIRRL